MIVPRESVENHSYQSKGAQSFADYTTSTCEDVVRVAFLTPEYVDRLEAFKAKNKQYEKKRDYKSRRKEIEPSGFVIDNEIDFETDQFAVCTNVTAAKLMVQGELHKAQKEDFSQDRKRRKYKSG